MLLRPLNDTLVIKLDDDQWTGDCQTPEVIKIPDAVIGYYKKKADLK